MGDTYYRFKKVREATSPKKMILEKTASNEYPQRLYFYDKHLFILKYFMLYGEGSQAY
jgi:hypothetical protein